MIKSILKNLNGKGSEAASLEAALLQLGRDRDETRTKIAELKKQRHTALLDDESDAAIGKIDLLIDRAEVRLEKLNAAEPPLLEKLSGARSAARQKRWRALRDAYLAAAGEFLASARSAADKHTALIAIITQAQCEGFAAEVAATMPATPNVGGHPLLAPELLDIFGRAISPPTPARQVAAPAPNREKTGRAVWQPASETFVRLDPGVSLQHAISSALPPPNSLVRLTAQRAADDLGPLGPGEVRVKMLRGGLPPSDDAPACHLHQKIRMAVETAEHRAALGLLEIIERPAPPAAASSDKPEGDSLCRQS
jgi:hypothetical protein